MDGVEFSQDMADEICKVISHTPKGLKKLCKENPHWPHASTIRSWAVDYPDFGTRYARAKMAQVDFYVEDAIEHAKDGSKDTYVDEKGKEKCDHEWVARSRLYVDTIKWYASKLASKVYGDRVQITHDNDQDDLVKKARAEVAKLKTDFEHGRTTEIEDRSTL